LILSPNNRSLYTEALTPPAGYSLDTAVAATFSMDLNTLLSVPLQLVLQSTEDRDELMKDPITLYEALQRATTRVHVFAQQGRIQAPRQHHLLYSLLEPMIVEVKAPNGGAFHPKMWLLRFIEEISGSVTYRLMLPSKNLTADRSWDVALTLDGSLGAEEDANGADLAEFVEKLPGLAVNSFIPSAELRSLLDELPNITWELPEGFDELQFHIFGFGGRQWRPKQNDRLAVISPFIRPKALEALASTSEWPLAVVSRAESLAEIGGAGPFKNAYVLHDAAETEDGEDAQGNDAEIGLHAKIYVYQIGNRTHIALGSANATDAALIANSNVEILAELAGPAHRVGGLFRLFNPDADDGLGQYLVPWDGDEVHVVDEGKQNSQRELEGIRAALLAANLTLTCSEQDDRWQIDLAAENLLERGKSCNVSAWPVTVGSERAVDLLPLFEGVAVRLPVQSLSSLTSLIAFKVQSGEESISFTLNIPVEGMPEQRERAILRGVVNNRDGFLRYLLLLLAGLGDGADVGSVARAFSSGNKNKPVAAFDDVPLLEELVRAFSRDPKRLLKVQRLISDITEEGEADDILPPGFMNLWQVFKEAMAHREQ